MKSILATLILSSFAQFAYGGIEITIWDLSTASTFGSTENTSGSTVGCLNEDYCRVVNQVGNGIMNNQPLSDFAEEVSLLTDAGVLATHLSDNEIQIAVLKIQLNLLGQKIQ